MTRIEEQIILHEGLRTMPYQDTEGYWTVGVGYNLSSRGLEQLSDYIKRTPCLRSPSQTLPFDGLVISEAEAHTILRADLERIEKVVRLALPEYDALGDVRQRVILDMAFNMGRRLLQFRLAISALKRSDWSRCARELHRSRWATQVKGRADRLATMMLTGVDYVV